MIINCNDYIKSVARCAAIKIGLLIDIFPRQKLFCIFINLTFLCSLNVAVSPSLVLLLLPNIYKNMWCYTSWHVVSANIFLVRVTKLLCAFSRIIFVIIVLILFLLWHLEIMYLSVVIEWQLGLIILLVELLGITVTFKQRIHSLALLACQYFLPASCFLINYEKAVSFHAITSIVLNSVGIIHFADRSIYSETYGFSDSPQFLFLVCA